MGWIDEGVGKHNELFLYMLPLEILHPKEAIADFSVYKSVIPTWKMT